MPALSSCSRLIFVEETPQRSLSSLMPRSLLTTPSITIRRSNPPLVNHSRTVSPKYTSLSLGNCISAVKTPRPSPWYTRTGCLGTESWISAMAGNSGCMTVPIGLSSNVWMRCEVAMTPTEPTVEKPHTAVPPRRVGSASA